MYDVSMPAAAVVAAIGARPRSAVFSFLPCALLIAAVSALQVGSNGYQFSSPASACSTFRGGDDNRRPTRVGGSNRRTSLRTAYRYPHSLPRGGGRHRIHSSNRNSIRSGTGGAPPAASTSTTNSVQSNLSTRAGASTGAAFLQARTSNDLHDNTDNNDKAARIQTSLAASRGGGSGSTGAAGTRRNINHDTNLSRNGKMQLPDQALLVKCVYISWCAVLGCLARLYTDDIGSANLALQVSCCTVRQKLAWHYVLTRL